MPLIPFFGLVHLGIAFPVLVLGRRRCRDQRGIDNGALTQKQSSLGQLRVDRVEDGFGQLMRFQQMAKFEQGRGIRRRFTIQIYADKTANSLTVVKRIFGCLFRKAEALLRSIRSSPTGGRPGPPPLG